MFGWLCIGLGGVHTPHEVAGCKGDDEGASPYSRAVLELYDNQGAIGCWDIRLCIALGGQEPGCDTGKDNYDQADDDAPAELRFPLANHPFILRGMVWSSCIPVRHSCVGLQFL